MKLNINPDWSFQDVVDNLKVLRTQYEEILHFFSYFDLHEEVLFMKNTRDAFYSLNFDEWKKDRIWDYMNHFEFYYVLKGIANRQNQK